MPTAHALMGLLARGQRCGYELRRELEDELGPEWRLDFGQLYRVLASLRRKRWAAARAERGERGPDRKVYTLTRRGRAELQRWLAQPGASVKRGRDEFPVKLRFGIAMRAVRTNELIAERRRVLEARQRAERGAEHRPSRAGDIGRWLVAETRRRQTEGALASLDSCDALVRPRRSARRAAEAHTLVAIGSDDLVLDLVARELANGYPEIRFSASPVGSLSGLIALREGRAHLAGIHLLDVDSGEYNVPFVKHLMPEEAMVLVNVAEREQGLLVARGNPKGIRRLRDLARPGIRLVNRQRGAGTRLLLYHRLREAGLDPRSIPGYEREAPTHAAVAAAIASGTADVGPGLRAVAQSWGLEFIPLGHERYDLAIPRGVFESPPLRPLLELLHGRAFRRAAAALTGYDVTHMSEVVADIH